MKKTLLVLSAMFALSAGSALACNDPECPHDPPKPPKKIFIR